MLLYEVYITERCEGVQVCAYCKTSPIHRCPQNIKIAAADGLDSGVDDLCSQQPSKRRAGRQARRQEGSNEATNGMQCEPCFMFPAITEEHSK